MGKNIPRQLMCLTVSDKSIFTNDHESHQGHDITSADTVKQSFNDLENGG